MKPNDANEQIFLNSLQPLSSSLSSLLGDDRHADLSHFNNELKSIFGKIEQLQQTSISHFDILKSQTGTTAQEKLYEATSNAKILASKVAMQLSPDYRNKLFAQIDSLHDAEDWDEDGIPLIASSFSTFLKTIIHINPTRYPGLGLSNDGFLIGAWTVDKNRLTIEFLPKDKVKWVLSRYVDENDEPERSASSSAVPRLLECLAPWQPNIWFYK